MLNVLWEKKKKVRYNTATLRHCDTARIVSYWANKICYSSRKTAPRDTATSPNLSYFTLPCLTMSNPAPHYTTLSHRTLPYLILPYPTLPSSSLTLPFVLLDFLLMSSRLQEGEECEGAVEGVDSAMSLLLGCNPDDGPKVSMSIFKHVFYCWSDLLYYPPLRTKMHTH